MKRRFFSQGAAVSNRRRRFGLLRAKAATAAARNRLPSFAALVCLLASCESTGYAPPPVTGKMAKTSAKQSAIGRTRRGEHVDLARLREGRTLFVSRCIECHTLPAVTRHTATEWPGIVDEMAGRASLKPAERDALLAYITAARAQK
jgi:hypothetical protein